MTWGKGLKPFVYHERPYIVASDAMPTPYDNHSAKENQRAKISGPPACAPVYVLAETIP